MKSTGKFGNSRRRTKLGSTGAKRGTVPLFGTALRSRSMVRRWKFGRPGAPSQTAKKCDWGGVPLLGDWPVEVHHLTKGATHGGG